MNLPNDLASNIDLIKKIMGKGKYILLRKIWESDMLNGYL